MAQLLLQIGIKLLLKQDGRSEVGDEATFVLKKVDDSTDIFEASADYYISVVVSSSKSESKSCMSRGFSVEETSVDCCLGFLK